MARSTDSRDRIANAPVVPGQEPAAGDEGMPVGVSTPGGDFYSYENRQFQQIHDAEIEAQRNSDLPNHQRAPEARVADNGPSREQLIGWGLSDAEIVLIMRKFSAATNGGLVEYDEDQEAERLEKLRKQQHEIAVIDGGQTIQAQLSYMEQYFVGAVPRGDGKYCKRLPFMSGKDQVVGINGYIFRIPKHKRVNLPTEVIDILEKSGQALGNFDMVSAAFQSRQFEPISMHEAIQNPEPHPAYYVEPRHGTSGYVPDLPGM